MYNLKTGVCKNLNFVALLGVPAHRLINGIS